MPLYKFEALDSRGKMIRGQKVASDEKGCELLLTQEGLIPIDLKPVKILETEGARLIRKYLPFKKKVKRRTLLEFTSNLASYLIAGVPLITALEDLIKEAEDKYFATILTLIKTDIEGGDSFSTALGHYKEVFSDLYVSIVQTGEETGTLVEALRDIEGFLEWQEELAGMVKQASTYPAVMLSGVIIVIYIITTFALPRIFKVVAQLGGTVPLPARILMEISHILAKFWYVPPLAALIFYVLMKIFSNTPAGKRKIDQLKLKLPVIGQINQKICLSRFMRYMGMMFKTGVGFLGSVGVLKESVGNKIFAEAIDNANQRVIEGEPLSVAFGKEEVFPLSVTRILRVGEETGRLDEALLKGSSYFDREVKAGVRRLISLLQPLMLVLIGGIVGVIFIIIFYTIYSSISQMR